MTRIILIVGLLLGLLISGCGRISAPEPDLPPKPESTPTLSAPDSEWTIKLNHSGGIMGLSRSIEVSSNGQFTVTDNRANKTVSGELTADDLSTLNEQVATLSPGPGGKPNGMACADCFVYDLEILKDGERIAARLSDITLSNSGFEEIISQLRGLMDKALG
jgi:hypothetical protein